VRRRRKSLVVVRILVQHVPRCHALGVRRRLSFHTPLVEKSCESKIFEMLELRTRPPRRAARTPVMWSSIEPPTSRNSSTFTLLCRSGTILNPDSPAFLAVERIVSSRSSSSGCPQRANLRRRFNATLMLRVRARPNRRDS
jgi:hypothetical protein